MGVPSDKVKLVLNRAGTSDGISQADVMSVLGRAPDVLVPSSRDIVRAVNRGEPIVLATKRSDAAKAFRALAGAYGDKPVAAGNGAGQSNGKRRLGRS
jgi:pilus assembly protein CpaE